MSLNCIILLRQCLNTNHSICFTSHLCFNLLIHLIYKWILIENFNIELLKQISLPPPSPPLPPPPPPVAYQVRRYIFEPHSEFTGSGCSIHQDPHHYAARRSLPSHANHMSTSLHDLGTLCRPPPPPLFYGSARWIKLHPPHEYRFKCYLKSTSHTTIYGRKPDSENFMLCCWFTLGDDKKKLLPVINVWLNKYDKTLTMII